MFQGIHIIIIVCLYSCFFWMNASLTVSSLLHFWSQSKGCQLRKDNLFRNAFSESSRSGDIRGEGERIVPRCNVIVGMDKTDQCFGHQPKVHKVGLLNLTTLFRKIMQPVTKNRRNNSFLDWVGGNCSKFSNTSRTSSSPWCSPSDSMWWAIYPNKSYFLLLIFAAILFTNENIDQ